MWAVFEPARTSVIPNITAGPQILVGNALSSTTWSFNLAVGSALGGLVASLFGRDTVFVINSVSFAVSGLLIGRMRFSEGHIANLPPLKARDLADFSPILEGVRYVKTDKRLLATMLVKGGLGLMGTNWVLLPIFGEKVFPVPLDGFDPRRAGMMGMSVLLGCRGVGALLGPLIGNYVAGWSESRLRRGILAGFLLAPAGYFCLSVAPNIFAACASVILAHAGGSIVWVFSTTLLQLQTEDRFRGRVFSVEFAFSMLAMSTVSSLAGTFYDHGVSVQALAAATGVIVLLPAAVWAMAQRLWRQAATKGLA